MSLRCLANCTIKIYHTVIHNFLRLICLSHYAMKVILLLAQNINGECNEKGAACLTVKVGSACDPPQVPGNLNTSLPSSL